MPISGRSRSLAAGRYQHLRQRIEAGEDIVADCRGGLGWSGMNSARLLVWSGVERVERGRATRPSVRRRVCR